MCNPQIMEKHLSQMSSQVMVAIAWYSASADEHETVDYFFVRQKMGLLPRNVQYLVTECRVVGQLAQSESE